MTRTTRIVLVPFLLAVTTSTVLAQNRLRYRAYVLGDDVATVSRHAGLSPTTSDTVPELRWQARYGRHDDAPGGDPVQRLIFNFYEERLYRIVVDYASDRTAGMTEGDMVTAVSKIFGRPTRRVDTMPAQGFEAGRPVAGVVAQWIDGDRYAALLTLQDGTTFRLVISSTRIEALALMAGADTVPDDVPDWTSIGASRSREAAEGGAQAQGREQTRRANVAAFVP